MTLPNFNYEEKLSNFDITHFILHIHEESNNYLKINLNQIYKIENNKKEIKLYLDNDTIIYLTI